VFICPLLLPVSETELRTLMIQLQRSREARLRAWAVLQGLREILHGALFLGTFHPRAISPDRRFLGARSASRKSWILLFWAIGH
jgi:hypothetical protein